MARLALSAAALLKCCFLVDLRILLSKWVTVSRKRYQRPFLWYFLNIFALNTTTKVSPCSIILEGNQPSLQLISEQLTTRNNRMMNRTTGKRRNRFGRTKVWNSKALCPQEQITNQKPATVNTFETQACALLTDMDRQKVSEAPLHSVCQTVKSCFSSLSSLHHHLPTPRSEEAHSSCPPLPAKIGPEDWRRTRRGEERIGEGRWIAFDTQSLHPIQTKPFSGAPAQPLV